MRDRWISRIVWCSLYYAYVDQILYGFNSCMHSMVVFVCLVAHLRVYCVIYGCDRKFIGTSRLFVFVTDWRGSLVAFDFVKCSMNSDKWHFGNSETCTFRLTIPWLHKGKSMLIFPKEWNNWFLVASTANVVKTIVISPVIKSDCSDRYRFFFSIDWNICGNQHRQPSE